MRASPSTREGIYNIPETERSYGVIRYFAWADDVCACVYHIVPRDMWRFALLLCDTPIPAVRSVYGTYIDIFHTMLQTSLERTRPGVKVHWELDGYDVVEQEYPSEDKLLQYDAILISGSAASAYASLAWTPPLFEFISKVASQHPGIKIFGICFGQQAVAMSLGGNCVANPKGWEVGTYEVELSAAGKLVFGQDALRIQEFHKDHVPALPPQFELLGSTTKCAVQGMALSSNKGVPIQSLQDIHILCVQGHPEFLPDIVQKMIDTREASGVLSKDVAAEARIRADREHDGVDVITRVFWDVILLSI